MLDKKLHGFPSDFNNTQICFGRYSTNSGNNRYTTITLPSSYSNTSYCILTTAVISNTSMDGNDVTMVQNYRYITTSTFEIRAYGSNVHYIFWFTLGY